MPWATVLEKKNLSSGKKAWQEALQAEKIKDLTEALNQAFFYSFSEDGTSPYWNNQSYRSKMIFHYECAADFTQEDIWKSQGAINTISSLHRNMEQTQQTHLLKITFDKKVFDQNIFPKHFENKEILYRAGEKVQIHSRL